MHWNKAEELQWFLSRVSKLVFRVWFHEDHVTCADLAGLSCVECLAATCENDDFVFVVMAVPGCESPGFEDEVSHREIGCAILATDHDAHGDALDALHLEGVAQFGIG